MKFRLNTENLSNLSEFKNDAVQDAAEKIVGGAAAASSWLKITWGKGVKPKKNLQQV